jgi:hypothetical protein
MIQIQEEPGFYEFTGLAPNTYYIQVVPTAGLGYILNNNNNQPLQKRLIVISMDYMERILLLM